MARALAVGQFMTADPGAGGGGYCRTLCDTAPMREFRIKPKNTASLRTRPINPSGTRRATPDKPWTQRARRLRLV